MSAAPGDVRHFSVGRISGIFGVDETPKVFENGKVDGVDELRKCPRTGKLTINTEPRFRSFSAKSVGRPGSVTKTSPPPERHTDATQLLFTSSTMSRPSTSMSGLGAGGGDGPVPFLPGNSFADPNVPPRPLPRLYASLCVRRVRSLCEQGGLTFSSRSSGRLMRAVVLTSRVIPCARAAEQLPQVPRVRLPRRHRHRVWHSR